MALHGKLDALRSLKPDVAIICECAEPERLLRKSDLSEAEAGVVWVGDNPNKGLAALAFNGFRVALAEEYDPSLHYIAPVKVTGPVAFNLLAVWAQNFSGGVTRKDQAGPLRLALDRYRAFLTASPSVVAGDFNNNVYWDRPGWPVNHADAVDILSGYGLVSAYHESRNERQGSESAPTIYWRDRRKDGPTYHIDYVFLPRTWSRRIREMEVGSYEDWCGSGLGDHVPLVVDVAV